MMYEITATLKTLRQEGFGSFFSKLAQYLGQLFFGGLLFARHHPDNLQPEQLLKYATTTAGGIIQPAQVESEILGLLSLLRERKPKTVVEIGTANGGSLFLFCRSVDVNAVVVSIDLPNGIHGGGSPYWKTLLFKRFKRPGQHLHFLRANSRSPETIGRLKTLLAGRTIDFLFIDGDHTYEGVKADYENYSPLVSKGGLIAFHDVCIHTVTTDCKVDVFWKEIQKSRNTIEFVDNPAQGWAGIGVIFN